MKKQVQQKSWAELKSLLVDRFSLQTVQRSLSSIGINSIQDIEDPSFVQRYCALPLGNQIHICKEIAGIYWKTLDFHLKNKTTQYDKPKAPVRIFH